MYGAAGAPARSASAPVVRSARRPPPQATGSVEKGSTPLLLTELPQSPSRSGPSEAGRHGKGCGCGETRARGRRQRRLGP